MAPSDLVTGVQVRTATDGDWPAIVLLENTGFGTVHHPDDLAAFRDLVPAGGTVVACEGATVIGVAFYLDLRLTVPGGAILPAAGISGVVVAPTHRRRGVLRAMYDELHRRIADAGYPIAALTASEGGIYGRFGYGPATVDHGLSVDRRFAVLHADAPDPGGVRLVETAECGGEFAAIYDRWRVITPGGLLRPQPLWNDLLADRPEERAGGTALFALLHPDGYALYRVHGEHPKTARVEEFRAVTAEAHAALWRALLGLDLIQEVAIGTYPDDPLPYLLTDTRLARTTGRKDHMWLRAMDVPAVLQARRYACELSVVLQLNDGFRSDGGRFALTVRDGQASCERTEAPVDAELDLDVLGMLYLGVHRASVMVRAGRLRCDDEAVVRRLDTAFVSDVPAQLGFFF
ncbi:enhanced intracellular survival protein Eis [Mycolicibacter sinensis]|uniref:Enhanced intracellular survival protein Eis n=1 Tax=Mycolicibacter sinensis (strain JDM601) TaxID=875328 RepID=F5YZ04_MYCSD|nr:MULTISPECIES: enhanced intracellular survival protein Eis [Mycobacteriaceae]AEF35496.1 enhanced intracellular survival protein Eis [Mycolicibacter sinensis]